jgi:hypothetical protein
MENVQKGGLVGQKSQEIWWENVVVNSDEGDEPKGGMVLSEADEGGKWKKWKEVRLFLSKWMEGTEEEGGNANDSAKVELGIGWSWICWSWNLQIE